MKKRKIQHVIPKLSLLAILSVLLSGLVPASQSAQAAAAIDTLPVECEPKMYIALTFDDGPRRSTTSKLLDGLAARGARCTFFLIGNLIAGNEDLVQRMESEGHQVGIHTYDHTILKGLSRRDFDRQVERTRAIMEGILQHNDFLLRPPCGFLDRNVQRWAAAPIILWSVDTSDWCCGNTGQVTQYVVKNAKNGDIVLMHDFYPTSVDAALCAIDQLQKKGAVFVTVEELFERNGRELEDGAVYYSVRKICPAITKTDENGPLAGNMAGKD